MRKDGNPKKWKMMFCKHIQHTWDSETLPQELSHPILVVIPKPLGGQRGIGLLETSWNVISRIINARLTETIPLHEDLHGFRNSRGTGTTLCEGKWLHEIAAHKGIPILQVLIDLTKAYDTLDKGRTIDLLAEYGVGFKALTLLDSIWSNQRVVTRTRGYHGKPFVVERGVTQRAIVSPMVFNIVVDVVLRHWKHVQGQETRGVDDRLTIFTVFYADDGKLSCWDHQEPQRGIELLTGMFARFGLHLNTKKTKVLVGLPGAIHHDLSSPAYKRRFEGTQNEESGEDTRAWKARKVNCPIFDLSMRQSSFARHLEEQHDKHRTLRPLRQGPRRSLFATEVVSISMPSNDEAYQCPVEGCPAWIKKKYAMQMHFCIKTPWTEGCYT